MGWKLAYAAHRAILTDLSPRARLALDFMCWHTLDAPRGDQGAGEYWGGHHGIAVCLIGTEQANTNTGRMAVKRAIHELISAGLVERIRDSAPGRTSAYRIKLEPHHGPVENTIPETT